MRLLDISFEWPEDNLALDEVLLDRAEEHRGGEVLRFWESPVPFVVLGVAQVLRQEVFEKNCVEDGIRILRRCSAGGCVLQGPGCLNYTLVLSHERSPDLRTIRGSYCYILNRLAQRLQAHGILAHHKGISDLAVGGKKVSGSAQRRRRNHILHHGTLLYKVDYAQMERYLREPIERPQYRGPRTHDVFVRAIPLTANELRNIVCEAFEVENHPLKPSPAEVRAAKALAQDKYSTDEWTRRR